MKKSVHPSVLQGSITAPPSKSIMQRAAIASFLADGECVIGNPCFSDDCVALLDCLEQMGAVIESGEAGIHISGSMKLPSIPLNTGESGLGTRLLVPLLALYGDEVILDGRGSMKRRPLSPITGVLKENGVRVTSENEGSLPLKIEGPIKAGKFELDGSLSSQFLSGLLMVLPLLNDDSLILVDDLKSKPYIDMTLQVMAYFGVDVAHDDYKSFRIKGNQKYKARSIFIDGDWSAASTMMVAGAVATRDAIRIEEVGGDFTQADQLITGALLFAGARIHREDNNYLIYPGKLRGIEFDATDCPDLFPALAALAVFAKKPSTITGVHRLQHKESNRAKAIQQEFSKLGIKVEVSGDKMIIYPGKVNPGTVDSHHDHRIAMACSILALKGGPITILNAACVSKSYPQFFEDLEKLGAVIGK